MNEYYIYIYDDLFSSEPKKSNKHTKICFQKFITLTLIDIHLWLLYVLLKQVTKSTNVAPPDFTHASFGYQMPSLIVSQLYCNTNFLALLVANPHYNCTYYRITHCTIFTYCIFFNSTKTMGNWVSYVLVLRINYPPMQIIYYHH